MSQKDKDTETKESTSAEASETSTESKSADDAAEEKNDVEVAEKTSDSEGEKASGSDTAEEKTSTSEAEADEAKALEAKADEAKADEAEADEAEADEVKASEAEASEAKASDSEADEAKASDSEAEADEAKAEADEAKASDADEAKASDADEAKASDADEAKASDSDSEEEKTSDTEADDADDKAAAKASSDADDGDGGDVKLEKSVSGGKVYGLLAEYNSPGELIHAASKVRDAGFTKWDCYSPFPVHGLDAAMAIKRTILPVIVFGIGLSGLLGGLALQYWANAYNWPWIVSGKPFFSIPANIPITFETTILASAIGTFFAMWILNKLPQVWHPFFKQDRFLKVTDDAFFIGIEADDPKFSLEKTKALLSDNGAIAIDVVKANTDPNRRKMPRPLLAFILVTISLALIPAALIAKARHSKSPDPHIHIFPDMDFQAKNKAQTTTNLFDDARSARPPVKGTVARGELKAMDHYYRGIKNGKWAINFPSQFPVSKEWMDRGQQQFGVYCAPCHGDNGLGQGMIHERTKRLQANAKAAWVPPSNVTEPQIVRQPHGQLFNTISNGIRSMPGYAAQISEEDRWAIVLYLRALQRSQNATLNDVPPESRTKLQ